MTESMASARELIERSWLRLKRDWKELLLFWLIMTGLAIVMGLTIGIIIMLKLGAVAGSVEEIKNFDVYAYLGSLTPAEIILPVVGISVLMVGIGLVMSAFGAGQILLVAEEEKKDFGSYVRRGFGMIVPLFVVNSLVGLIVFGNLFLLVIPALIAMIYLGLTTYELLLGGKRGKNALIASATSVNQHFGYIVKRILVVIGIQIVVEIVAEMLKSGGESTELITSIFKTVGGTLTSWFGMIYGVELYKEVKKKTDESKPAKIGWMWVTAVIGFVIWGLLIFGSFYVFSKIGADYGIPSDNNWKLPKPIQEN